ncbi:MAG: tRNA (adenosine(37)-N6)-threonylcarbamoyltransferase complex transferase subunit TsaD [Patescibacteria group bacterium]
MKILAIETSCDETAIAILEIKEQKSPKFKLLANIVSSQVKLHAEWGGVVPSLAKREHLKNLPLILKRSLFKAKIKNPKKEIDLIAVTNGPGLEPALWTGINFAKDLAKKWDKPILPTNHMEGHLFSVLLNKKEFTIPKIELPVIALLVSGGHTELILIKDWLKYKLLGQTRDDAAGEAFDKVARMLNLGYPGGPAISKLAKPVGNRISHKIELPRPMINDYSPEGEFDFSFSGLKTAVLYETKKLKTLDKKTKTEICAEFQQAVIDVLISKTLRATEKYKAKTVIVAGGVAANKELRKQFKKVALTSDSKYMLLFPEIKNTGDNAAMIALTAYFRWNKNKKPVRSINSGRALKANGNLKIA